MQGINHIHGIEEIAGHYEQVIMRFIFLIFGE